MSSGGPFLLAGCSGTADDTSSTVVDADGDGISPAAGDCNDRDLSVYPGATEACDERDSNCDGSLVDGFPDFDGDRTPDCVDTDDDGDGDPDPSDCDDANPSIRNGATDSPSSAADEDCNGVNAAICLKDADRDGYGAGTVVQADGDCTDPGELPEGSPDGDCDDSDASAHPGATEEVGNGEDEDCDGREACFADDDRDGFRTEETVSSTDRDCSNPGEALASVESGDCDDAAAAVYPGATEVIANGVDEDCDGRETCFTDIDKDGYRGSGTTRSDDMDCVDPGEAGSTASIGDCDDGDATEFPGATEVVGNGEDDDCDGRESCFADRDGDGVRTIDTVTSSDADCADSGEALVAAPTGDCDDLDAADRPGATETVGNGDDEDCDGAELCYSDNDNDGYRTTTTRASADVDCSDPGEALASTAANDCDDADADAADNPGATETADNGDDDNCDGAEACYADADRDGYRTSTLISSVDFDCLDAGEAASTVTAGDCDDSDASDFPGATEVIGNGDDESCDGAEVCYRNADGDAYRTSATVTSADADCADAGEALASVTSGDCDDADAADYPGATETIGNGDDENCDGSETCYVNVDGDGYRLTTTVASADADCADAGEALSTIPSGDCDDADSGDYPGATETVANGDDEDCNGAELCYTNLDGDGYRVSTTVVSADADCSDAGEALASLAGGDCNDSNSAISPGAAETELAKCTDGIDQDCDGKNDLSDSSCACSVAEAARAGRSLSCPSAAVVPGVTGTAAAFALDTRSVEFGVSADETFSCTTPVFVRTGSDIRGFSVGTDVSGLGVQTYPVWLGSSGGRPVGSSSTAEENCYAGDISAACLFPATPDTMPESGCYAVSFVSHPALAGTSVSMVTAMNRTTTWAERIDFHAVIAGSTDISEDQITDVLSVASILFERQGLSLGKVSFERISGFTTVDLSTDLPTLFATPNRTGATPRAVTVIFSQNLLSGSGSVIGISAGIPGLLGTTHTAGSGVFATASLRDSSGRLDLGKTGRLVAHEVGHFLGLRHTSEINYGEYGRAHDYLTDTPECSPPGGVALTPDLCVGSGAEYIMFPILDERSYDYSDQQGAVLSGLAPGPATSCSSHAGCGADEVCVAASGTCEHAWMRPYTFYLDEAWVATTKPGGAAWDIGGGYPDPYASYSLGGLVDGGDFSGFTDTINGTFHPQWWYGRTVAVLKSRSDLSITLYDEDLSGSDFIDRYYIPAPIPIELLRSPTYIHYGTYSTLSYGFQPL